MNKITLVSKRRGVSKVFFNLLSGHSWCLPGATEGRRAQQESCCDPEGHDGTQRQVHKSHKLWFIDSMIAVTYHCVHYVNMSFYDLNTYAVCAVRSNTVFTLFQEEFPEEEEGSVGAAEKLESLHEKSRKKGLFFFFFMKLRDCSWSNTLPNVSHNKVNIHWLHPLFELSLQPDPERLRASSCEDQGPKASVSFPKAERSSHHHTEPGRVFFVHFI